MFVDFNSGIYALGILMILTGGLLGWLLLLIWSRVDLLETNVINADARVENLSVDHERDFVTAELKLNVIDARVDAFVAKYDAEGGYEPVAELAAIKAIASFLNEQADLAASRASVAGNAMNKLLLKSDAIQELAVRINDRTQMPMRFADE